MTKTSLNQILEAQLVGKTLKEAGNKGCNEQGSKIEDAYICTDSGDDPILRLVLRTGVDNTVAISIDPNDTFTLED